MTTVKQFIWGIMVICAQTTLLISSMYALKYVGEKMPDTHASELCFIIIVIGLVVSLLFLAPARYEGDKVKK